MLVSERHQKRERGDRSERPTGLPATRRIKTERPERVQLTDAQKLGDIHMNRDASGNRIVLIPMPRELEGTEHESCPPFIRQGSMCARPEICTKNHTRLDKMPPAVQIIWKAHQKLHKNILSFNPACCSIPNAPKEPFKLSEKGEPIKKRKMSPP